jgi:cytochrome c-type biogenesis protein CcmH/NrfF
VAAAVAGAATAAARGCSVTQLEDQVMCPTCKGQTLAESTAPASDRVRHQIGVWSNDGLSCSQIKDRLQGQFGPSILASPATHGFGLLAWVLPLAGLGLGAVVLGLLAWRWSRGREEPEPEPASSGLARSDPNLERRIDDELARFDR